MHAPQARSSAGTATLRMHAPHAASVQILKGLSFKVEAGQKVAIVGCSGSGKSTALKLLARLYRPESGSVRVQGVDVNDVRQESLRRHAGHRASERLHHGEYPLR
jgi:ABC-type multidrug transport system fused ATPase/permease subunit